MIKSINDAPASSLIGAEGKSAEKQRRRTKWQSVKALESKFANLPHELQTELSLKVTALHQKTVLPSGTNVACSRKLQHDEIRYESEPVLVQTIRTKAAEERNKAIRGLTILDKELFIVSEESSKVEVYDSMKFSLSRRYNVKKLIGPEDIGSCDINKCLYIFNCKAHSLSNKILRVDPNGKLIKKWSTGEDYGFALSITDETNVILTVFNKNKLNEYSPDGQLIREIHLSSCAGFCSPCHAIKLTSGHFVISHGYFTDCLRRVCIVDGNGKLMKSFGGKWGSTTGQMDLPVHLSVDGNGFVMVCDLMNCRVLLLDSDLKFKNEILSNEKHGLQQPQRILIDESNCRLLVAENEVGCNGRILIFDFK